MFGPRLICISDIFVYQLPLSRLQPPLLAFLLLPMHSFKHLFIYLFIECLLYARYHHGYTLDCIREKRQINISALKDSARVAMIVDIPH